MLHTAMLYFMLCYCHAIRKCCFCKQAYERQEWSACAQQLSCGWHVACGQLVVMSLPMPLPMLLVSCYAIVMLRAAVQAEAAAALLPCYTVATQTLKQKRE